MCLAGNCGSILVSYTRGVLVAALNPFTVMTNFLSLNLVKTFRKNSIVSSEHYLSQLINIFRIYLK